MDTESATSGDESSYKDSDSPMQSITQSPKRKRKASISARKRRRDDPDQTSNSAPESGEPSKKGRQKRKHIRLKGHYSDQYRQLYNKVILDANQAPHTNHSSGSETSEQFDTSQIGMSLWTAEQKHALFHAIERYGRDNLPRLAAVTEKSEGEVFDYLQLLRDGLLEYATIPAGGLRTLAGKLPAAAELSGECCEALETVAEALSWYQESWDSKQAKKEHGDYWLLNRGIASKIDKLYSDNDHNNDSFSGSEGEMESDLEASSSDATSQLSKTSIFKAIPAAGLLNLSKFLDLSERVFMNSTESAKNWRTYQDPAPLRTSVKQIHTNEQGPSIFHTTFSDFHRIIVSLTRRLVHVSIFQATARLRATDSLTRKLLHKPAVQRRDVLTALRVTGVKEDSIEFWAKLPSRNKHNWIYQRNAARRSKAIAVQSREAERWLSLPLKRIRPIDEGAELELDSERADETELRSEETPSGDELDEPNDNDEEMIDLVDSRDHQLCSDDNLTDGEGSEQNLSKLEKANDRYFEILDTIHSRRVERKLWGMLELQEPTSVHLNSVRVPPEPERAPLVGYGSPQEEWRDWTEPAATWEILLAVNGNSDEESQGSVDEFERSEITLGGGGSGFQESDIQQEEGEAEIDSGSDGESREFRASSTDSE